MNSIRRHVILGAFVLFLWVPCAEAAERTETPEVSSLRETAVLQARKGEYKAALEALRSLREHHPDDQLLVYDYMVVLGWAGRYADVAALSVSTRPDQVPEYAVGQIAAALRKAGKLVEAQRWYDLAAGCFPGNADIAIGRALTMGDRGQGSRGLGTLNAYARAYPTGNAKALAEARAYLQRRLEPPKPYVPLSRPATAYRSEQDDAVAAARQGRLPEALDRMKRLRRNHPKDQFLLSDYLVLLQWNRENEQVAALAKELQLSVAPAYALETVVKALTRIRGPYAAGQFMEAALAAQRRNPELLVSVASMLAESGDPYKAVLYLDEAERSRTPGLGRRIEEARKKAGAASLEAIDDLAQAEQNLSGDSGDLDALKRKALALGSAGGAREARHVVDSRFAGARSTALPQERVQGIRRDAGLESAHWGEESALPRYLEEHGRRLEDSLASLDALAASPECAASEQCLARTKMARIKPLYALGRAREVTAEYECLQRGSLPPTSAAQLAAAGAYLSLRKPRDAANVYNAVIVRSKNGTLSRDRDDLFRAESGLFWAYLEDERLADAFAQAQKSYERAVRPEECGRSAPNI